MTTWWLLDGSRRHPRWHGSKVRKTRCDRAFLLLFLYFVIVLCFLFIIKLIFKIKQLARITISKNYDDSVLNTKPKARMMSTLNTKPKRRRRSTLNTKSEAITTIRVLYTQKSEARTRITTRTTV